MWLTLARNLGELARNDGFNEYFQKQFNENEATYLRWKEVFDVLEIVWGRGCHHNVKVNLEKQTLSITRLEDVVKLRALARLCSQEFFDDISLLVVAWRKILEILELAMPPVVEKKVRGKKKQKKKKNDPRKSEIFYACFALGRVCNNVLDGDDARRYYKRAKEGYEEQLGRDSEKALDPTQSLTMISCSSCADLIEKLRDVLKRFKRALGEENTVNLETLNTRGCELRENEEYEEAKEVHERCLVGRVKVLGEDHQLTLDSLNNLRVVYTKLKNYEKVLEYYGLAELKTSHHNDESYDT